MEQVASCVCCKIWELHVDKSIHFWCRRGLKLPSLILVQTLNDFTVNIYHSPCIKKNYSSYLFNTKENFFVENSSCEKICISKYAVCQFLLFSRSVETVLTLLFSCLKLIVLWSLLAECQNFLFSVLLPTADPGWTRTCHCEPATGGENECKSLIFFSASKQFLCQIYKLVWCKFLLSVFTFFSYFESWCDSRKQKWKKLSERGLMQCFLVGLTVTGPDERSIVGLTSWTEH